MASKHQYTKVSPEEAEGKAPTVTFVAVHEQDTDKDARMIAFQMLSFAFGFVFVFPWLLAACVPKLTGRVRHMHTVEKAMWMVHVVLSLLFVGLVLFFVALLSSGVVDEEGLEAKMEYDMDDSNLTGVGHIISMHF